MYRFWRLREWIKSPGRERTNASFFLSASVFFMVPLTSTASNFFWLKIEV